MKKYPIKFIAQIGLTSDPPKDWERSGIYVLINIYTNHMYIGSSRNVRSRLLDHRSSLQAGRHENKPLQKAWYSHNGGGFLACVIRFVAEHDRYSLESQILTELTAVDSPCAQYMYNVQGNLLLNAQRQELGYAQNLSNRRQRYYRNRAKEVAASVRNKQVRDFELDKEFRETLEQIEHVLW